MIENYDSDYVKIKTIKIRLLGTLYPKKLKPLKELIPRFNKFDNCLCYKCKWKKSIFFPNPCEHRQNYAWAKCKHFNPIACNGFLAKKVRRVTEYGLSLDEAIALFRNELGKEFIP